jgi:hypothetical protein
LGTNLKTTFWNAGTCASGLARLQHDLDARVLAASV